MFIQHYKVHALAVLLCLVASQIRAQKINRYETSLTTGNHMVSFPFQRAWGTTYHPAIGLGIARFFNSTRHQGALARFNAGWFYNRYNTYGLSLDGHIGYRYTAPFGAFAEADLAVGYIHAFLPRTSFGLKDGRYQEARDLGTPGIKIGSVLSVGMDLSKVSKSNLRIFAQYQWYAQTPYNAATPIWPQAIGSIGLAAPLSSFMKEGK